MPLAVLAFQGRLVAGVGKALRLYDLGKKKLLRKVENKASISGAIGFIRDYYLTYHLRPDLLVSYCHISNARFQNLSGGHAGVYLLRCVQATREPTSCFCR